MLIIATNGAKVICKRILPTPFKKLENIELQFIIDIYKHKQTERLVEIFISSPTQILKNDEDKNIINNEANRLRKNNFNNF